jgi:predicted 3-demethylubiquinone-9 3-methyltransferase (glyoxalase superfamily)
MSNNIHPCLWFDGNAKAAAEFYCSLFPDSAITVDSPMVVNFKLNGQKFMGLNGGPMYKFNPSISLFVSCETREETDKLYSKLIEGGMAMMPLDKYDWCDHYAFLQDKFGLAWQLFTVQNYEVTQKINPCLLFVGDNYGKAERAVNYYSTTFPGSSIDSIKLYEEQEGAQVAGKVKHSQFILDGKLYMAMDGAGNHGFTFNEAISFVVECKDQAEIDKYWNHLTANGGQESMCGWLKDPFGVSWQIIPANLGALIMNPVNGQKAMQALLKMKKLVIDELVNA